MVVVSHAVSVHLMPALVNQRLLQPPLLQARTQAMSLQVTLHSLQLRDLSASDAAAVGAELTQVGQIQIEVK